MRTRLSTALIVLALAGAYFGLISIERLPYAQVPLWWMELWPSKPAGTVAWMGALDLIGALGAAIPVALVVAWNGDLVRARLAWLIAAPVVVYGLVGIREYWADSHAHHDLQLMACLSAAARLVAVPVAVLAVTDLLARLRSPVAAARGPR